MTTTVLRNGTLFDGHRYAGPGAVVVRDGRIAAVLTGRDLDDLDRDWPAARGATTHVDLQGGLLAPGFVDAHVHTVQGGLERIRCDLSGGRTREDYLALVADHAARHPDLPWILGGGWAMAAFPGGTPTAADLDAVVPDRPVFLPNRDHHGAWVNSRALALAGLDEHTPDPPHGRVERDADLAARRAEYTCGRFRATSVKIMQDGVAENGTAAMTAPYLDRCGHATANAGHSFVEPRALREHVAALAAEGFQVHVHAIGDRGVREALDAFEHARGARDLRHHVAHLQVVHPDDVARFAALGVAANMQALWACLDEQMTELTLPFLGAERSRWQYPFGDLHRAGARLVAGSDWPVTTPDPLEAIHVAVNRWAYGEEGPAGSEPFLPEQALDLETAFAAYTSGSAWVNHRDDAGVLAPGAVADLVVLDRDPFAGEVAEIGAAGVVSTWVDGVPVFEA